MALNALLVATAALIAATSAANPSIHVNGASSGRYEVYQVSVEATESVNNPFTDVDFNTTFTGPQGEIKVWLEPLRVVCIQASISSQSLHSAATVVSNLHLDQASNCALLGPRVLRWQPDIRCTGCL
jgi:hypothetical protein